MSKSDYQEKPPIGVKPRYIYNLHCRSERKKQLRDAIKRYMTADKKVPIEWVVEFNELTENR